MKVFVAPYPGINYISDLKYNWCNENEILTFGLFQTEAGTPSEISMCGINSRKFTTDIEIKNLDIDKQFYTELIKNSIENSMDCVIDDYTGNFEIEVGFPMSFNLFKMIEELIEKANEFQIGDIVKCYGRNLIKTTEKEKQLEDKYL